MGKTNNGELTQSSNSNIGLKLLSKPEFEFADFNNDGKNDLLLGTVESISSPNRFLTNLGLGRFNQTAITNLPVRSIKNAERIDYIIDDLNGDGLDELVMSLNFQEIDENYQKFFYNTLIKNSHTRLGRSHARSVGSTF